MGEVLGELPDLVLVEVLVELPNVVLVEVLVELPDLVLVEVLVELPDLVLVEVLIDLVQPETLTLITQGERVYNLIISGMALVQHYAVDVWAEDVHLNFRVIQDVPSSSPKKGLNENIRILSMSPKIVEEEKKKEKEEKEEKEEKKEIKVYDLSRSVLYAGLSRQKKKGVEL